MIKFMIWIFSMKKYDEIYDEIYVFLVLAFLGSF